MDPTRKGKVIHYSKPADLGLPLSEPKLVIAFEYKDLCGGNSLASSLSRMMNDSALDKHFFEKFLHEEQTSILVALDGYDEEFYHCKDVGVRKEVRRIVSQENNKHFNLIVTTRPWKRLLHERYKEISIAKEKK